MARTPSTMLPLGTAAPDFALPDTVGRLTTRDGETGPMGLLVMFICNHCPYVQLVADELARLGRDAKVLGIGVVAINSNDADAYPADNPRQMAVEAEARGYEFPYLFDATQSVAKAYQAACTPDFYLFDGRQKLVYRGQLDSARPGNGVPVTGVDLRAAIAALTASDHARLAALDQRPSIGCNIKWRPGNAPN